MKDLSSDVLASTNGGEAARHVTGKGITVGLVGTGDEAGRFAGQGGTDDEVTEG